MVDTPQRTLQEKPTIKMLRVTNLEEFLKAHPLKITLNDPNDSTKEMHYVTDDIFPCDSLQKDFEGSVRPIVPVAFKNKIIKRKAFLEALLSRIHDDIRKNELKKKNRKAFLRVGIMEAVVKKTLDDIKAMIDQDVKMQKTRETLVTLYNFEEELNLRIKYYTNIQEVFLND